MYGMILIVLPVYTLTMIQRAKDMEIILGTDAAVLSKNEWHRLFQKAVQSGSIRKPKPLGRQVIPDAEKDCIRDAVSHLLLISLR